MNKFFSKNLPWKIVSLILATLLWFFVINYQNPILTQEKQAAFVTIRGISELEEKGYVLQNEDELRDMNVRILLKGPRLDMERVTNEKLQIEVSVDLTQEALMLTSDDADSIEKAIEVKARVNVDGVTVEDVRPKTVSAVFEKEKKEVKNIQYTIKGGANSEYTALEPTLKPTKVEISGPKSSVEKVQTARVDINVDNFSQDTLSYTIPIKLLDEEGNEVVGVKMVPEQVEVILPIGKKKKVPLEPQFKGNLPPGYTKANTIVNPKEITIVGAANIIDEIESIKLEKIPLDNMIQSNTVNVGIILPNGVECIDNIEDKVVVAIEIQKESTYDYYLNIDTLPIQVAGLPEGYDYEIMPTNFKITLSSTAEKLLAFKVSELSGTVDFSTITAVEAGEYTVPLKIKVPEDFKIMNEPFYITVKVIDTQEEVTPPTDEPVGTPEEDETTPPEN